MKELLLILILISCKVEAQNPVAEEASNHKHRFGVELIPSGLIVGKVSAGFNFQFGKSFQVRFTGSKSYFGYQDWEKSAGLNGLFIFKSHSKIHALAGFGIGAGILTKRQYYRSCQVVHGSSGYPMNYCYDVERKENYKFVSLKLLLGFSLNLSTHWSILGLSGVRYMVLEENERFPEDHYLLPTGELAIQFRF